LLTDSQMERIRLFAEEVAVREGCILYDLEFRDGPGRTLRVFIDKEPGGVGIEDCANVSRGLNLRLDVEDAVPGGAYDLEVSSPGLDRKLTQFWHYEKAVGQTVQIKYRDDDSGQSKPYEGKLVRAAEQSLDFENNKGPFNVKFENVQKGRVVIQDALPKKPAPGKKKR
jgi:ribosome maturation factor RimP